MDPVQPEASVVQTGLGIRYVGEFAYAFSGNIEITNAPRTSADIPMLDFTTGAGILVGTICFTEDSVGNDEVYFEITINGESVILVKYDATPPNEISIPYPITIPPLSHVQVKWGCSGNDTATAWLTGRIYGVK